MKWKELSKYLGMFIFAVAVIAVYKTFDNIDKIFGWFGYLISLLKPFIIGFVIAYVLVVPCRFIERMLLKRSSGFLAKHRRAIAVAAIYILFLLGIVLALVAIIPALISSLVEFYNNLPSLIEDFVNWFNSLKLDVSIGEDTLRQLFDNEFFSVQKIMTYMNFDNMNRYAQGVISAGSGLFSVFMGIIISVYTLLDRANLKQTLNRLFRLIFRDKSRGFVLKYMSRINEYANKYIYCMLVDALIIFIVSFIILSVEGVKYAPLLALMTGLFNLIPYFGAITATVLTCIITVFTGSLTQAVIALVSLIVLQQLDANFIQPKLYSGSLQVKPFWVIMGILLGGGLFGFVGFFLAVPITALCRSIFIDIVNYQESKAAVAAPQAETAAEAEADESKIFKRKPKPPANEE